MLTAQMESRWMDGEDLRCRPHNLTREIQLSFSCAISANVISFVILFFFCPHNGKKLPLAFLHCHSCFTQLQLSLVI